MPNFNGLIECTSVTATGDVNTPYYLRADANGSLNVSTIATNVVVAGDLSGATYIPGVDYGVLLENHTGITFTDISGNRNYFFGPQGPLSTLNTASGVSYAKDVLGVLNIDSNVGSTYGSLATKELIFASGDPVTDDGPYANISCDTATGQLLAINASTITMNASTITMSNVVNYTIPGTANYGQRGTSQMRPVFINGSNVVSKPSQPPIRFFTVTTPSTPGQNTVLLDGAGSNYTSAEWTCFPVGFTNNGGSNADRSYECFCVIDTVGNWYVRYSSAGGDGLVTICAINNSFYIGGPTNGIWPV